MNGSILNCNIVITDLPNDSDFKQIYFYIKNHILYLKGRVLYPQKYSGTCRYLRYVSLQLIFFHYITQGYHHLGHGEPMERLSSLPPMTSFRQTGMHHGQSSPYLHSSVSPPLNGSDPMGMVFGLKLNLQF